MNKKPTLSAAIITYNEERNIKDCLDSLTNLVDEIIVVDSFSTDATENICRNNSKVLFFQHPFDGHIQQKNRALEKCSSEWILSLDADERVTPELGHSIETFLSNHPKAVGVKFPRLTFYMNRFIRHGGWYPNARYRLVKKGKAYWGGVNPHDKLIIKGKKTSIKGDLIHFSYRDLSDHVQTINKYSSITALVRYNKGKTYWLWRLLFKPVGTFLETYFYKLGFLDGTPGFINSVTALYSTFLNEAKQYELSVLGMEKPSNLSDLFKKTR